MSTKVEIVATFFIKSIKWNNYKIPYLFIKDNRFPLDSERKKWNRKIKECAVHEARVVHATRTI